MEFKLDGNMIRPLALAAFQSGVLETLENLGYVWDFDETSPLDKGVVTFKIHGLVHKDDDQPPGDRWQKAVNMSKEFGGNPGDYYMET